jgi:hypothetical protein
MFAVIVWDTAELTVPVRLPFQSAVFNKVETANVTRAGPGSLQLVDYEILQSGRWFLTLRNYLLYPSSGHNCFLP